MLICMEIVVSLISGFNRSTLGLEEIINRIVYKSTSLIQWV